MLNYMPKLNQKGVVHLLVPILLLLGLVATLYIVTQGSPLKLFSKATLEDKIEFKSLPSDSTTLPTNSNGIPKLQVYVPEAYAGVGNTAPYVWVEVTSKNPSQSGNTGAGNPVLGVNTNNFGKAVNIPNGENYITVSKPKNLSPQRPMTIESWVFLPKNIINYTPLIIKDGGTLIAPSNQKIDGYSMFNLTFSNGYTNNQFTKQFITALVDSNLKLEADASYNLTESSLNTWHHLATVYDGKSISFYIDGNKVQSKNLVQNKTVNGYFDNDDYPLYFGDKNNAKGFMLDEVRISQGVRYTDNFTPSSQPFTPDSSTLALWHFDGDLKDASSNGNDGVATGQISFVDFVTSSPTINPTPTSQPTPTATPIPTSTPTTPPTPTPTPAQIYTTHFQIAESLVDLDKAPLIPYTPATKAFGYTFKDKAHGVKSLLVKFTDSEGPKHQVDTKYSQIEIVYAAASSPSPSPTSVPTLTPTPISYTPPSPRTSNTVTDNGKAFKGNVSFKARIDPNNSGVTLTRRLDYWVGNQIGEVSIDGNLVGRWSTPGSDRQNRWRDVDFSIPQSFTQGKSQINVKIKYISSYIDWNEFYYWIKSNLTSGSIVTDDIDVGNAYSELSHNYIINYQSWSGSLTATYPAGNQPTPTPINSSSPITSPTPTLAPTPKPSVLPIASSYKRVFKTDHYYTGNMGGLIGADNLCRQSANNANLGGTWKAWLSDSKTSASNRISHSTVPYKRLDGKTLADNWNDLTDGNIQNPISITEYGVYSQDAPVWTNTLPNGNIKNTNSTYSCNDWTSSRGCSFFGGRQYCTESSSQGNDGSTGSEWTDRTSIACSYSDSIYCFEQ